MGERDGETEKWSFCSEGGGGVGKSLETPVNCGCVACSHGGRGLDGDLSLYEPTDDV